MNKFRLSLLLNIVLLSCAVFFSWKRFTFQHALIQQELHHAYLDNPQYIEQTNLQATYIRQADIVLFGDSHIYKAQWNELLNRDDVAARGIGGDITEGYLHRIDQVLQVHPRIVFIEGGSNDLYNHVPVDTIILHLQMIIGVLHTHGIIPVLHQLPPFATSEPTAADFNARLQKLNVRIGQLAEREGIACIDLYSLLSEDGYLRQEYAQPDGCHLSAAGYQLWAQQILLILRSPQPIKNS